MKAQFLLVVVAALGLFSTAALAADKAARPPRAQVTVCVIDTKAEKNPTYYGLATLLTRLKCEIPDTEDKILTLGALYNNGWRLVQVVGEGWLRPMAGKQQALSPIYYMEREIR